MKLYSQRSPFHCDQRTGCIEGATEYDGKNVNEFRNTYLPKGQFPANFRSLDAPERNP